MTTDSSSAAWQHMPLKHQELKIQYNVAIIRVLFLLLLLLCVMYFDEGERKGERERRALRGDRTALPKTFSYFLSFLLSFSSSLSLSPHQSQVPSSFL
jgi:hypothetical protein